MNVVWKFPCPSPNGEGKPSWVVLPKGAKTLCVQPQQAAGSVFLWALVDPEEPKSARPFYVVATGEEFMSGPNVRYVGTVQLLDGALVYHVFEDSSWDSPTTEEV